MKDNDAVSYHHRGDDNVTAFNSLLWSALSMLCLIDYPAVMDYDLYMCYDTLKSRTWVVAWLKSNG